MNKFNQIIFVLIEEEYHSVSIDLYVVVFAINLTLFHTHALMILLKISNGIVSLET